MKECMLCGLFNDEEQSIIEENETCYFIQKASEQEVLIGSGLIIPKAHKMNVFSFPDLLMSLMLEKGFGIG